MKALRIILLSILSLFTALYLAFLFALPNCVDLNQYSPKITKLIQDKTGFQVNLEGLKVKTAWNLSAGAFVDKTDLMYPTGKKFAQINGMQIRLSLLPLFLGHITVDKVDLDKAIFELEVEKNGDFLLQKYLNKTSPNNQVLKLKFSDNMPNINAKKYRISFIDAQSTKTYSIKGNNLKISDFVLNKKIKLKTNGNLILNGRSQITYNVSIFSKVFPEMFANGGKNFDIIKIFEDLYKYNVDADVNTNLRIKKAKHKILKTDLANDIDIAGQVALNKISFTLGGIILPKSNLKLDFEGNNVKINSTLYTGIDSKAFVTGRLKNGKHKAIDLRVVSNHMNIGNIVLISNTFLKTIGKKELEGMKADGDLNADFNVKSDFKKIQSSGYLKIKNASLANKLYNVSLNAINAEIDFSKDSISFKQAHANLNNQPIEIKGNIDKNANANISVFAKNLPLKGVLLTSGKVKLLSQNDILGGLVNVDAYLKGRLDKATPQINVVVSNVNLKNKQSKTQIKFTKAVINNISNAHNSKNKSRAEITNLNVLPAAPTSVSIPKIALTFDKKNLNIEKTFLYINGVRTNLQGKISDINSNPKFNSVNISVPKLVSMPIKGYAGSSITLKGDLVINGSLYQPEIQGFFTIPVVNIPTMSIVLKDITLQSNKYVSTVNCTSMKFATSMMGFSAQIINNFSDIPKGIVAKNVNLFADVIDLNSLIPVFRNISKNSNPNSKFNVTILNGRAAIDKFKTGNIAANDITSSLALKNNILFLNNLKGTAYLGKIAGAVSYDIPRSKVKLDLQGRGLSANPALQGLTGKDDDIHGILDFDSNISLTGGARAELLRSLNGGANFIISNGQMGILGKFEHLIYAQNVISNNVFKATLNLVAKAATIKNTGSYKYMKGKITLNNGWLNINSIKTSGPYMSLYITGRYNMLYDMANLVVLGRISDDVVRVLGPIGELSMDKVISSIPKIGQITSFFVNQFTINPNYENISMIPNLTPQTEFPTKEFKVIIDGEAHKQSSVKSFKWISNPKVIKNPETEEVDQVIPSKNQSVPNPQIPDFVKKLPDLK